MVFPAFARRRYVLGSTDQVATTLVVQNETEGIDGQSHGQCARHAKATSATRNMPPKEWASRETTGKKVDKYTKMKSVDETCDETTEEARTRNPARSPRHSTTNELR